MIMRGFLNALKGKLMGVFPTKNPHANDPLLSKVPAYETWPHVPLQHLNETSIVYNFGVGESIALEFVLSGLTACSVYHFDPTPRSAQHFALCQQLLELTEHQRQDFIKQNANPAFGGGDKNYLSIIAQSNANINNQHFMNVGLYNEDATLDFFLPKNKEHVSLSIDNLQETEESIQLQVLTIDSIMSKLNHQVIDYLKLNIEGAEVVSIIHMLENSAVRPKFMSIKMELSRDKPGIETDRLQLQLETLLAKDYRIIFQNKDSYTYQLN